MRILYVSGAYVPSRRASSIHVMRMCAALARQGHDVVLVTKSCAPRQESGVDDPFAFYGVPRSFTLRPLPRPARRGGGLTFLRGVSRLVADDPGFDLYYCREPVAAWRTARRGRRVVFEAHGLPGRWTAPIQRQLLAAPELRRLVVISRALRDLHDQRGLLPRHGDTLVAHDAADPIAVGEAEPVGGRPPRLGYVGHLYPGRGIELLLRLAERRPGCELHLVGGSETDLARRRHGELPANVIFHGFLPPAELAKRYATFDVLLMPYQERVAVAGGRSDTGRWMSPLKMFEYMSTGRPIIASDLPVLREVLRHEGNALLVPPRDLDGWDAALARLLGRPELGRRLGAAARREFLHQHTWDARAARVLRGL